ncbi:MAG: YgaP family membrane protein [Campylobacterota bacterium]
MACSIKKPAKTPRILAGVVIITAGVYYNSSIVALIGSIPVVFALIGFCPICFIKKPK